MGDLTMTQPTTPRQRPPKAAYVIINPVFKMLLRSPLHNLMSKRLLTLTFTGRKSGKRYEIPVGYVQDRNTLLITTESPWWKNLRGGKSVLVRLRGQNRAGVADVITDEERLYESYRVMLPAGPELGQIIGVALDPDGRPNREDVRRARERGYVVVRTQLT
jgi:deazaflavin-dependent oxidoreductase (nitroreductase family)